jgi:hypothetical protein
MSAVRSQPSELKSGRYLVQKAQSMSLNHIGDHHFAQARLGNLLYLVVQTAAER